jgi:hypothetical protein
MGFAVPVCLVSLTYLVIAHVPLTLALQINTSFTLQILVVTVMLIVLLVLMEQQQNVTHA